MIFKAKSNPSVYILASQILLLALKDSYNWPESVAKVTAISTRTCSECKTRFVLNHSMSAARINLYTIVPAIN